MKITALVENKSESACEAVHGLSLYIEMPGHRLLFDLGPDDTLFKNSETLGIDLVGVDTVVISHGHSDHGGALEKFLSVNTTARVYVQRSAFDKYYAKSNFKKREIGLNAQLKTHPQIVLLDGDYSISDELKLITTPDISKYRSTANNVLFNSAGRDDFRHEHSLIILGSANVLIIGCGHTGVVNILDKAAGYDPHVCVGGYHLWNPTKKKTVSEKLLRGISEELSKRDVRFYTCHCTGQEAYDYMHERVPDIRYLHCGETIEL